MEGPGAGRRLTAWARRGRANAASIIGCEGLTVDLNMTLDTLRRALVQPPDNGFLWLQVAETLAQLGRASEAEEAAREALIHLDDEEARRRARGFLPEAP